MENTDYCDSSEDEAVMINSNNVDDEDIYCGPSSLCKLQFRNSPSKARWDDEKGMAKVIEKKGKLWITTGIIRDGNTYCTVEETLFLAEVGALVVVGQDDTLFGLPDLYMKSGCMWEEFEVYRQLKSLGYIVIRHGLPWTLKSGFDKLKDNEMLEDANGVEEMLSSLKIGVGGGGGDEEHELQPVFNVYLPNSKFRKSAPGDPAFMLCLIRGDPPSCAKIEDLERYCCGIPVKICHVEHGRVTFFSIEQVELSVLP